MSQTTGSEQSFEMLLDYIKRNRGFDFGGYKRTSLQRRFRKRMAELSIDSYTEYLDYLEVHPGEFAQLFNTVLINVTDFFRDREAWAYLQSDVVPRILSHNTDSIRIWSAGCASGQEPCTIAIIFCEALGVQEYQRRVKIYATDIDEEALATARQASYTQEELKNVPHEFREKYFSQANNKWALRAELRRTIICGRHDLVQDAPISQLDLIVCRNTLMYLNAETQARILARMHFALKDTGFLFLGKAEMLLSHTNLFSQADLRFRVFTKVSKTNLKERLFVIAPEGQTQSANYLNRYNRLRELAFDSALLGQIVVSKDGALCLANERARSMFGVTTADVGRNFADLEVSYRPVELRSIIDQVYKEQRVLTVPKVARQMKSGVQYLDIEAVPLVAASGHPIGVSISFEDVTDFEHLVQELQATHEELQTTNEELQSTNEELETTNEELHSTNEELETTNEELQSINEELETTNEELQSTNEELETTNNELAGLAKEVQYTNLFLQSILGSMKAGVIVLDSENRILVWNHQSEELWGLRADEVTGTKFESLDIGFPTHRVLDTLKEPLSDREFRHQRLEAVNRRGRHINCDVCITPLVSNVGGRGIVLFIDEVVS